MIVQNDLDEDGYMALKDIQLMLCNWKVRHAKVCAGTTLAVGV